ncbi:GH25 family lysozyme [Thioclava litoralis]|uniref:GH25 family lysozyme n=1 Tax=Thioclava litoralis TaxID=3076557 RepID=A0ABZ1DYZ4_9RHOB|nr:GH25 family lysozyme [Thioclava sp. FTW29]
MTSIRKLVATLGLALSLASCGSGPMVGKLVNPSPLNPADYTAPGIPLQFGDRSPHPWDDLAPASYSVHGIDAARYQGLVDWRRARSSGIRFAWLKATEGGDYIDPGYGLNAKSARSAGVAVGAYHFYYFCRTPQEQARWYINRVKRVSGDLPPVLDIEWNHQSKTCRRFPNPETVRAEMRTFLDIVTAHYGTRPVIYTTVDFWHDNDLERLGNYDFWLRSVADHPRDRYPGVRWTFWQYTGTGIVPGIGGTVDLNAFAGSPTGWANWYTARQQP